MAYTDKTTGRNQRTAVMIAVALIQGAAIVALVNGLAVKFIGKPPETRTSTYQVPSEPRPEPKQPKRVEPAKTDPQITRTTTTIPTRTDVYSPPGHFQLLPPIGDGPIIDDFGFKPPPPPDPVPSFAPRMPRPLGKPGLWVTADDYPTADLRRENQGVTGFTLSVGANGQVLSCTVTSTSGFLGLDAAACRNLERRARFEPATDSTGNKVTGEYKSKIRWEIPH